MGANAFYFRNKLIPLIKDLLLKEGISIEADNIKCWGCDYMNLSDVVVGCNYVKNNTKSPVVVYTNEVPNRDTIAKNEGVKIFDSENLKELAMKYKEYEIFDLLSK